MLKESHKVCVYKLSYETPSRLYKRLDVASTNVLFRMFDTTNLVNIHLFILRDVEIIVSQ